MIKWFAELLEKRVQKKQQEIIKLKWKKARLEQIKRERLK